MNRFVIGNLNDDELLWNNEDGWVIDNPTIFTEEETRTLTLPDAGDWFLVEDKSDV